VVTDTEVDSQCRPFTVRGFEFVPYMTDIN
jgi:hypothetical protein